MVFRFKKFDVIQQHSAMKVGTDGVLLGAWADFNKPKSILDIGTGTGLIALMLAQRFKNATITAIEIDKNAANEASQNFINSKWNHRLKVITTDFENWNETVKFDMLVCNPPYFTTDLQSPDKQRAMARGGVKPGTSFIGLATRFMHEQSQLFFVIPANQLDVYLQEAKAVGLHKSKTLFVKPTESKKPKRVLVSFGFRKVENATGDDLILEVGGRHRYSAAYKKLTGDFYLKF